MKDLTYTPSQEILDAYARVLVHFALGSKEGINSGEVVQVMVPDIAKPLAKSLQKTLLKAGAHVLMRLLPTGLDRDYFELATEEQLNFFPAGYLKSRADLIDHNIAIIADPDPSELEGVDPQKIFRARNSQKSYRDWLTAKEVNGKFTWTAALWGVEAKAQIVGLSLEEYWQQIIQACYLDTADPIAEWRKTKAMQLDLKKKLNQLSIEFVKVTGPDVNLKVQLGADRIWVGGADRNIPSYELFASPNWRGCEGTISFNQPLYRYGHILEGVSFEIRGGLVVQAHAKRGEHLLNEMLKTPGANKLGEFSLTDRKISKITHFMAETLYDENVGGPHGNTHVAIGMAYRDALRGDRTKLSEKDWHQLGFNDSAEHTDFVSTSPRTVTAHLSDGTQKVIYQDGQFTL